MADLPTGPGSSWDRRSAAELVLVFLGGSVLFSLLGIDLVQRVTDDPGYDGRTLLIGALIGTAIGLGLTLLSVWTQRGSRRRGRRLGRQAWRTGHLPTAEPDRTLAVRNLRLRRRAMETGVPPIVSVGIWGLVGIVQIVTSRSTLHTVTWIVLSGLLIGAAVWSMRDRRRRPQLDALLDEADRSGASTPDDHP